MVIGEIAGLEVARIDLGGDEPVLSVGVGQFDRDLNDMLADMEGPIRPSSSPRRPERSLSTAGRERHPTRCTGCAGSAGSGRRSWPNRARSGALDLVPVPPLPRRRPAGARTGAGSGRGHRRRRNARRVFHRGRSHAWRSSPPNYASGMRPTLDWCWRSRKPTTTRSPGNWPVPWSGCGARSSRSRRRGSARRSRSLH